ncbi:hypothetical protein [Natranaeroarchaeum sulfidigenes]|uniref:Uncharacterized protein n=1 Tax=Natranaeroarchaeum sulfidigenes TaxID=2784880 RepID=A0A897MVQ5_9EURY|nr:hypothetical protein [Natranaeroarchaeum sulfidigenes]QSG03153.1 hypothetical protein AArcS_1950 [Natranaeroarchaeum sulfidigenes]
MRRTIRRGRGTFDPSRDLRPDKRVGLGESETMGLYVPLDFVLIRTVVGGSPPTPRVETNEIGSDGSDPKGLYAQLSFV